MEQQLAPSALSIRADDHRMSQSLLV